MLVVEREPAPVDGIDAIGGVVAAIHPSEVIAHGVKVVYKLSRLLPLGHLVLNFN